MSDTPYSIIASRRNSKLAAKDSIYKLLSDSYKGGYDYINAKPSHLEQYEREYTEAYNKRQKRSVYINFVQPIVDLLTGFVYREPPNRSKVPPSLEIITERASKRKGMTSFMMSLCPQAIMMTMGVLVDSPAFDSTVYQTEADRLSAGLQPYACMYFPWHIRDFACDSQMKLEWVLLDDSHTVKNDPLKKAEDVKVYRLWTKQKYQDFEIKDDAQSGTKTVVMTKEGTHGLGEVPFHFVNVRDSDDDHVSDSPLEDIGILSRMIYNIMSYLDEMLASGTFKTLFYPILNKEDIPEAVKKKGLSDSPVATFNGNMSKQPYFDGAKLEEVEPFIQAFNLYKLQIFSKVGMDVDRDKTYIQSGAAMGKEFQKTEALLRGISEAMEECEKFIYRMAALWQREKIEVEVEYSKNYQPADVAAEFERLKAVYDMAQPDMSRLALEKIAKIVFPDEDAKKISDGEWKREPQMSPLVPPNSAPAGANNSPEVTT